MQKNKQDISPATRLRKKRFSLIILLLSVLYMSSFTQGFKGSQYDKQLISINPAIVFSGDGDAFGIGNEISYLKTIGKRFYLKQGLASWIVNGSSWIDGAFENQTGVDLSAELGISPFKMNKRILSISGGICGAYFINSSPSSGGTWSMYNYKTDEYSYVSSYNQGYEEGFDYGITFGINYFSQLSPLLYLNARANFRTHFVYGSAISLISIGIGFDANQLFK